MGRHRNTSSDLETVPAFAEEMYDGLLKRARQHGTFWNMFSGSDQTESRRFFLSLPEEQKEFLIRAAAIEALLAS